MRTGTSPNCGDTRHHVELCAKLLLLLIGHRILRKLNSTGDKWAHLPDIARWLKEDDSKVGTSFLLLIGKISKSKVLNLSMKNLIFSLSLSFNINTEMMIR